MKNNFLSFVILFYICTLTTFSQENFEKGFLIDLHGDTLRGFINNNDRVQNPEKVIFMLENDSVTHTYLPENIKKFKVGRNLYLSAKIELPSESGTQGNENSASKQLWVFLLTIAEGTRSLYYFTDESLSGSYFIKQDGELTKLNYREYVVTDNKGVITEKKDQRYKGQLMLYLQDCPKLKEEISGMILNERDMNKLFMKYYSCQSETAYVRKMKKTRVEFGALGGASLTNVIFKTVDESKYILPVANADYQTSIQPLFGVYSEFIFPKNHEKLSLFAEGLYSSIHIKGEYVIQSSIEQNHVDYTDDIAVKQAMLNIALRYKIDMGKLKLFFDAGLSFAFTLSSETSISGIQYYNGSIVRYPEREAIIIKNDEEGAFAGMGLAYSRFTVETRYRIGNGITGSGDQASSETKTKQLSFVLGFRVL